MAGSHAWAWGRARSLPPRSPLPARPDGEREPLRSPSCNALWQAGGARQPKPSRRTGCLSVCLDLDRNP
eukprot:scaffold139621_cov33-Tisochrysis_lutea.AAC.1